MIDYLLQPLICERFLTDAGRTAFEKAFEYKVVAPYSEMNQMIEDENKLKRHELYK